ncbi:C40 family peptidase [Halothiobacillus sp.]|uniref:C40 family peptidase n=1 Tax=Halothiobacillus sp. TaxID=1891311 RepID=UPI00260F238A|nr:C40 family peptidase [Halothiobacillus sp.]MDY0147141.1 C40 family peptidase [Halothiobacillus sp.]
MTLPARQIDAVCSKSGIATTHNATIDAGVRKHLLPALGVIVCAAFGLGGCATLPNEDSNQASNGLGWLNASTRSGDENYSFRNGTLNPKLPSTPIKAIDDPNGVRTAATEAILQAISQLGTAYQWGGTSNKKGFDCSGLTSYVYKKADIELPRTARDQYAFTERIARSQLKPGDLLFFKIRSRKIDHVGIYVGDNRFIHAPRKGEHVTFAHLNNAYWRKHFAGAGRVPGARKFDTADLNALNAQ